MISTYTVSSSGKNTFFLYLSVVCLKLILNGIACVHVYFNLVPKLHPLSALRKLNVHQPGDAAMYTLQFWIHIIIHVVGVVLIVSSHRLALLQTTGHPCWS